MKLVPLRQIDVWLKDGWAVVISSFPFKISHKQVHRSGSRKGVLSLLPRPLGPHLCFQHSVSAAVYVFSFVSLITWICEDVVQDMTSLDHWIIAAVKTTVLHCWQTVRLMNGEMGGERGLRSHCNFQWLNLRHSPWSIRVSNHTYTKEWCIHSISYCNV